MAVFAKPARPSFAAGQPIELQVTLKNASSRAFTFLGNPQYLKWDVAIVNAKSGKAWDLKWSDERDLPGRELPLVLEPGKSVAVTIVAGGDLPAGTYQLSFATTMHGATANVALAGLPALWWGELRTGAVAATVGAADGEKD